jgi:signal transduction histidine kinase
MEKFILTDFLQQNRSKIIEEWLKRLHTDVSNHYSQRPREELMATVREAFDGYFHVLAQSDFDHINRFIEKITQKRMEAGFLLSDVQKAFELYRSVVVPLLAKESKITTIEEFCNNIIKINCCMAYTTYRFSDHFQNMHEKNVLEHNRRLDAAERLAALGKMANRVAHELRNPLTIVGGFSRRLNEKTPEGDPDKKYLAMVVDAVMALEDNISKIIKIENDEQQKKQQGHH